MSDTFFTRSGSSPGSTGNAEPDFIVENHFTIFLLFPCSDSAKTWCDKNLAADRMTWCGATVVEARYFPAVLLGIQDAGLIAVPRAAVNRG